MPRFVPFGTSPNCSWQADGVLWIGRKEKEVVEMEAMALGRELGRVTKGG